MKYISFLLLLFISCNNSLDKVITSATNRYVLIFAGESFGSGIIVDSGYVIVAKHVVENVDTIFVIGENNKETGVIIDSVDDQLLLKVNNFNYVKVITNTVQLGQTVWWIQPLFQGKNLNLYFNSGKVNRIKDNSFFIDAPIMPGASGSGVYNENGDLVGVIVSLTYFNNQILYGRAFNNKNIDALLSRLDNRKIYQN